MNDDEIRIAVAESVGWQRWRSKAGKVALRKPTEETAEYWRSFGCEITTEEITEPFPKTFPVPDYPNDLNAMHEVEKTMTDDQYFGAYTQHLCDLAFTRSRSATAHQRCEAYLRTIGRWKE